MDSSLRDLLDLRQRRSGGRRIGSALVSLLLHAGVAGAFLFAPALAAREAEPMQYTKVQIVPLRALGVPDPPPARRREKAPQEPEPPAEERPATPAPDEERKRVPSPDAEPRRPSEPRPGPSAAAPDEPRAGDEQRAQRRGTRDGSPLGLAPFGSNESGFDDPDFQYSYYRDMLHAIIGSNYRRPAIAAEVELIIHFRIARDGTIYDVEITQPSGYASFDQAGLSAVRSSTLPRLPVSYPHDSLGVSLIIR